MMKDPKKNESLGSYFQVNLTFPKPCSLPRLVNRSNEGGHHITRSIAALQVIRVPDQSVPLPPSQTLTSIPVLASYSQELGEAESTTHKNMWDPFLSYITHQHLVISQQNNQSDVLPLLLPNP